MTTEASLTIMAICQLLWTLAIVGLAIAILVTVKKAKTAVEAKTQEMMDKIDPIIADVKNISTQAKDTVDTLAARVDNVAGRVEDTATKLTEHVDNMSEQVEQTTSRLVDRVDSVADRIDSAVTPQVASAAGTVATVAKVIEVLIRTSNVAKSARKAAGDQDT
jgi:peptidoglycan hydrolase CwlO-like protein